MRVVIIVVNFFSTLRGLTISSTIEAAMTLWISAVCSKSLAMKCHALDTVPTFSLLALNSFPASLLTPLE